MDQFDPEKKTKLAGLHLKIGVLGVIFFNSYFLKLKSVCLPVLNCHSCRLASFSCPVGVVGHFLSLRLFPFITAGGMVLAGIVFGRLSCGWVCPFGFLQDALYKIRSGKIRLLPFFEYARYPFLFITALLAPYLLGSETLLFFCQFCPQATLTAGLPGIWIIEKIPPFYRLAVLFSVLGLSVFISRFFCRTACPLGAFLGLFNRISFLKIEKKEGDCAGCGTCLSGCPAGITDIKDINSPGCIKCLNCTACKKLALTVAK